MGLFDLFKKPYAGYTLKQKAEFVGDNIILTSTDIMEALYKNEPYKSIDNQKAQEIWQEFIFLFTHIADRAAFALLELESERAVFVDYLMNHITKKMLNFKSSEVSEDTFKSALSDSFNERQEEYSKYTMDKPEEDKGYAGNLFWEFGKKIAFITDGSTNIIYVTFGFTYAAKMYPTLQVEEVLKG